MWMPSLDLATGLWARMRRTLYTLFSRLSRAAQRFWMSRAYFPVLLTVSAAFMAAGEPVYGVAALGCIVIWLLAACPDLLAPVCPFFMAFLMSSQCYGQLTDFLPCAALVPPLLVALLWHFAVWPVTLRIGRSGLGLALVSIATLLGGCDVISRKQAMEPLSLYYTLGLGVGMLVLYVLFRSHLTEKRSYDLHRRFAEIFCALGLCMALAVLLAYGKAWLAEGHIGGVLYLSYRNFATSVLLTALPMPFYLSLRHRGHLATAAVLALALALTGSRSALLFGGILLTLCCVYLMRSGVISRRHRHPGPGPGPAGVRAPQPRRRGHSGQQLRPAAIPGPGGGRFPAAPGVRHRPVQHPQRRRIHRRGGQHGVLSQQSGPGHGQHGPGGHRGLWPPAPRPHRPAAPGEPGPLCPDPDPVLSGHVPDLPV